jgi:hypothetical protein
MRCLPRLAAVGRLLILGAAALTLPACGAARAATLEIEGPAGAAVTLDGRAVGTLPLAAPLTLAPGDHTVACALRGCETLTTRFTVADPSETRRLRARLTPLRRREALLYSLAFAGLGQRYVGRPTLGLAFSALEAGGLLAGLTGELALRNSRSDYLVLEDAYRHALDPAYIASTRAAADAAWRDVQDAESLRRTGLLVAAGAVVVSALDAWLRFPGLEAGAGAMPEQAAAAPVAGATPAAAVHLAWTARF